MICVWISWLILYHLLSSLFISLNLFPLPASLFQIEIAQQADGSGIHVFSEPAYGYIHFQKKDDRDNKNQVAGQGYYLQQEGRAGVTCTGYGLEENESGALEEIAGAEYPEGRDGMPKNPISRRRE